MTGGKKFHIIREIFKGDHNVAVAAAVVAAAVSKLKRKQISALSGTLND